MPVPPSEHHATATVVGGGPAGLIAAEELARGGLDVTVHEHRASVGRKFLLAGRGGLNITNSESDDRFLARYGPAADRLESALIAFGPTELRSWCAGLGEPTFTGTTGRVFPSSFRATPLLRAWLRRLDGLGVRLETRHRWAGWDRSGANVFIDADGAESVASTDVTVLALGGASWPRVGSDGAWVTSFSESGVDVRPLRAANVGVRVAWTDVFAERFAGEPLKGVACAVGEVTLRGDPIVTETGLEGGPIYALTVPIRAELDRRGRCELHLDLQPDQSVDRIAQRLDRRRHKETLTTWLRRTTALHPVMIGLLREATGNRLPTDPAGMAGLVKDLTIPVVAQMPIDRAISTAGGIAFDQLDDAFMLMTRPGTFVAGEMLDWEAPTGGYLLQASFSTGVAAARGALAWLADSAGVPDSDQDRVGPEQHP